MQKTFLLAIFILGLLAGVFVLAQINYPIPELGNCQNEAECKTYCETVNHIEECLNFAKIHKLLTPAEIAETEKVAKVWKAGVAFPGGCQTKSECLAYCNEPTNIDECLDFAEAAELISLDELREARQVAKGLAKGITTPGNCWRRQECRTYCADPSHRRECVAYARAIGLISPEEADLAERVMPLIERGESPGGCKSKTECEAYCADENHAEECVQFASKTGLMTEEELEMFRKTKGKRPGNCRSKEECEAFCNEPANQETCFEFAAQYGLIPQAQIQQTRANLKRMYEGFQHANQEVINCLNSSIGPENVEKIRSRNFMPTPQIGRQIGSCFEQYMGPPEGLPEAPPRGFPEGFIGPGGCTTLEECEAYCSDPAHFEECMEFQP